jgi:hypothetical protein
MKTWMFALMLVIFSSFASAQGLTGNYSLTQNGQALNLQLRDSGGQVTGTLTGDGGTYQLQGRSRGVEAEGVISDGQEQFYFYLNVQGNQLTLVVADFDDNNRPDQSTAQQFVFTRQGNTPQNNTSSNTTRPPASSAPATKPNPSPSVAAPKATSNAEWRNGAKFAAGARVSSKPHGVAFVVPQGFTGQSAQGVAILGNGKGIGALLLPFLGATSTDVVALMSRPLEVAQGVTLQPTGAARANGNRLTLNYVANTAQGQIVATGIAVLGKGNGVALYVFSDGSQTAAVDRLASSLAAGVTFTTATATATLQQARQALSGKYLNFFSYSSLPGGTYTGASDSSSSRTWNLCSNGTYSYEGSSENRFTLVNPPAADGSSFGTSPDRVGVANGNGSANAGRWRLIAVGDQLVLLFYANDGSVDDYLVSNLERRGGKLPYLDGKELSSFGQSNVCR